ncbi:hypothetical protein BC781_105107 [Sediminitomix flava]|uniref:Uncharacterized protein n=2 Tax=Sediminitomix flava TaxID=379075 RepID=A0A315Z7C4_SEDFL|nr:hypothetical protein BC781_105107 [Sediminitomix flava]
MSLIEKGYGIHSHITTNDMKKYREDIKVIFQALSFIALYIAISMIDNPVGAIISGGVWFFVWSLNIYDIIKYRNQKSQDEIRFPTQNDSYSKMTSLSLGCMLIIGMIIWIALLTEFTFIPIVGLIAGLLILINGIIYLPKGQIKLENSKLISFGLKEEIELSKIESINIDRNQITIRKEKNSTIKLDRLELNKKWTSKISEFLYEKLNTEEVKITCGNTI